MGVWPTSLVMSAATRRAGGIADSTAMAGSVYPTARGAHRTLLLVRRRTFLGLRRNREISRPRPHRQLAHALGRRVQLDATESRLGSRLGRAISDGVLVADIARHFRGNLIDVLNRPGEERYAAGLRRKHLQRPPRMPHLGAAHFVAEQEADRIN